MQAKHVHAACKHAKVRMHSIGNDKKTAKGYCACLSDSKGLSNADVDVVKGFQDCVSRVLV
jgi:hypothetical protein